MSHAATNWAIRQRGLKPATKIVLWHLADCHNGHTGQCNPRQDTLADMCEMSRSTLNLHLRKLEDVGLIKRHSTVDPSTKRQRPTHYTLAMDGGEQRAPEPRDGIGKADSENRTRQQHLAVSSPKTGHGAASENPPDPCPKKRQSRVRKSDTKNHGREPGTEPTPQPPKGGRRREASRFGVSEEVKELLRGTSQ
ncbi:MAG: helix-turn-helix domain-containing protein [Halothiobacillaceae bacterium]